MTHRALRVLVTSASAVQIAFGVWHFFVPRLWGWYRYIDPAATELVVAVRAVNFFFSLCLVLIGVQNLLLLFGERAGAYALRVALAVSAALWLARVVMQLLFPQGSIAPALQYGMLACFVSVFAMYVAAFVQAPKSDGEER